MCRSLRARRILAPRCLVFLGLAALLSQMAVVRPASAQAISPTVLNLLKQQPLWVPPMYQSVMGVGVPNTLAQTLQVGLVVPQTELDADPHGVLGSYQPAGATITGTNAFFQPLGTNGRSCATCHQPSDAMGMSAASVQQRLLSTLGTDPLFAPVDGANCPNTGGLPLLNQAGYSLLLKYGLIRIPLPVPANAEYTITVASDPNGCNSNAAYNTAVNPVTGAKQQIISTYRRPLIAANLQFKVLSGVDTGGAPAIDLVTGEPILKDPATGHYLNGNIMSDGREPTLLSQALDATLGHAQATKAPTAAQLAQMVEFESGIFSAQSSDSLIGSLTQNGLKGGPVLVSQSAGGVVPATGQQVFSDFNALNPATALTTAAQASVYRGQQVFNNLTFIISNDAGINNIPGVPNGIQSTCSGCHSQVNGGTEIFPHGQHTVGIGGMQVSQGGPAPSSYLPLFKVTCKAGLTTPFNGTTVLVNDPGKALITGKCADIGRFSVPQMHGLAARAPYMHDGSLATLMDVVNMYQKRFNIAFTAQNKTDLVAFLNTL
jgi:cytochrome c peroxidase